MGRLCARSEKLETLVPVVGSREWWHRAAEGAESRRFSELFRMDGTLVPDLESLKAAVGKPSAHAMMGPLFTAVSGATGKLEDSELTYRRKCARLTWEVSIALGVCPAPTLEAVRWMKEQRTEGVRALLAHVDEVLLHWSRRSLDASIDHLGDDDPDYVPCTSSDYWDTVDRVRQITCPNRDTESSAAVPRAVAVDDRPLVPVTCLLPATGYEHFLRCVWCGCQCSLPKGGKRATAVVRCLCRSSLYCSMACCHSDERHNCCDVLQKMRAVLGRISTACKNVALVVVGASAFPVPLATAMEDLSRPTIVPNAKDADLAFLYSHQELARDSLMLELKPLVDARFTTKSR